MGSKPARRKLVRLRQRTNPDFTLRPSNERLRAHLEDLNTVLSIAEISRRSGVPEATVHGQLKNSKGHTMCLLDTAQALMRVRLSDEERAAHMTLDERMWGGYRIIQGLMALGWTQAAIGQEAALTEHMTRAIARTPREDRRYQLGKASYARLREAADRLEPLDPIVDGKIDQKQSRQVRARALGRGAAPLTAWDLDTIHRLDQIPDWTGACGTPQGYAIHRREDIPVCGPCDRSVRQHVEPDEEQGSGRRFSPPNFRILIEKRKLTVNEVAELTGATDDSIRRWSAGERAPRPDFLERIVAALDCDMEDLMDDEIFRDCDFNRGAFRAALEAKNQSIRGLALEIGVSNMAITYWLSGKNTPKIPKIAKAADFLGMDWKDFYR